MTPTAEDADLFRGAAGLTLAHAQYAHSGAEPWVAAQRWAATLTRRPVPAHPAGGLQRGVCAAAFALTAAHQPAWASAVHVLHQQVTALTRRRLEHAYQRINDCRLPDLGEWDLISGLTGIGAYQLRHGDADLLRTILSYLVILTQPLPVDGDPQPGWWTRTAPPGFAAHPRWHGGHGNLGIAHGISGPLALLSLAATRHVVVPGQPEAIDRICRWLDQYRIDTATGSWWPEVISRHQAHTRPARQPQPGRPSWCYGTPGIARAQQLAGLALDDPHRRRIAEDALTGCLADPAGLAQFTDASLCHGWAGLLQTTWRAAHLPGATTQLADHLPALRQRTRQQLHRHKPAGVHGLLEGSTGVQLALHTTSTATPPVTDWDACLLLNH